MKKIRVVIADGSVVYRSQIRAALQDIPWIEIVGVASNGRLAIERISQSPTDLLISGLEMSELDGTQTLSELRKRGFTCEVIVFSLDAFRLGAGDFFTKPNGLEIDTVSVESPSDKIKSFLEPKILSLFPSLIESRRPPTDLNEFASVTRKPNLAWDLFRPKIVVIGSSTGGPTVLEKIFSELKTPLNCPVVIVQHMPAVFTATFAERLEKLSGMRTFEAEHGMALKDNCIYVAPGNYHLRLKRNSENTIISLDQGPLINSVRPAVDPLFSSAASIFKDHCLGIVLTGMGSDGKDGAIDVKNAGGAMVIQDEDSCVVFGMPGAVFAAGAYDVIADPKNIIEILKEKAGAF